MIMEFTFKHSETGRIRKLILSEAEVRNLLDVDDLGDAFYDQECKCQPIGETNVVECSCPDYLDFFELQDA